MKRRDLLKLGASVATTPALGIAQEHNHAAAGTAKPAAEWTPELFDDHQNQTVIALVDLIIPATDTPGAKAALVNRHMDHILGAAPEDEKTSFREGLWWVDGYAIRKHGKPFASCTAAEQTAILKTLDAGTDPDTGRRGWIGRTPHKLLFGRSRVTTASRSCSPHCRERACPRRWRTRS